MPNVERSHRRRGGAVVLEPSAARFGAAARHARPASARCSCSGSARAQGGDGAALRPRDRFPAAAPLRRSPPRSAGPSPPGVHLAVSTGLGACSRRPGCWRRHLAARRRTAASAGCSLSTSCDIARLRSRRPSAATPLRASRRRCARWDCCSAAVRRRPPPRMRPSVLQLWRAARRRPRRARRRPASPSTRASSQHALVDASLPPPPPPPAPPVTHRWRRRRGTSRAVAARGLRGRAAPPLPRLHPCDVARFGRPRRLEGAREGPLLPPRRRKLETELRASRLRVRWHARRQRKRRHRAASISAPRPGARGGGFAKDIARAGGVRFAPTQSGGAATRRRRRSLPYDLPAVRPSAEARPGRDARPLGGRSSRCRPRAGATGAASRRRRTEYSSDGEVSCHRVERSRARQR